MTLTLMSSVIKWKGIQVLYILLTLLNLNIALTSQFHSITNIPFKLFHVANQKSFSTIASYEHIRFQDNKIHCSDQKY